MQYTLLSNKVCRYVLTISTTIIQRSRKVCLKFWFAIYLEEDTELNSIYQNAMISVEISKEE